MSRCPEDQKIVVRGLPSGIDQSEVEDYFNKIGRVADVWFKDSGRDTFGFVGFESKGDYEEALSRNGQEFQGHVLRIEAKGAPRGGAAGGRGAGGRGGDRDATKVFVRGIGSATDDEIRAFFEKIGPVTDYFRREGTGFCFVGFDNPRDHQKAISMSGEEISGNRITVEQKGGAGGRGGGRNDRDNEQQGGDRRVRRSHTPPRREERHRRRSSTPPRRRGDSRSPPRRRDSVSPPRRRRDSRSPKRQRRSRS